LQLSQIVSCDIRLIYYSLDPPLFKYSIQYITKYFWYKKVPELAVLVKSIKSMDEGCLQCEVKDPTGQTDATINRDLIDKYLNQQPIQGVVLHVKWVRSLAFFLIFEVICVYTALAIS
jgi:hypothetical protein